MLFLVVYECVEAMHLPLFWSSLRGFVFTLSDLDNSFEDWLLKFGTHFPKLGYSKN